MYWNHLWYQFLFFTISFCFLFFLFKSLLIISRSPVKFFCSSTKLFVRLGHFSRTKAKKFDTATWIWNLYTNAHDFDSHNNDLENISQKVLSVWYVFRRCSFFQLLANWSYSHDLVFYLIPSYFITIYLSLFDAKESVIFCLFSLDMLWPWFTPSLYVWCRRIRTFFNFFLLDTLWPWFTSSFYVQCWRIRIISWLSFFFLKFICFEFFFFIKTNFWVQYPFTRSICISWDNTFDLFVLIN